MPRMTSRYEATGRRPLTDHEPHRPAHVSQEGGSLRAAADDVHEPWSHHQAAKRRTRATSVEDRPPTDVPEGMEGSYYL